MVLAELFAKLGFDVDKEGLSLALQGVQHVKDKLKEMGETVKEVSDFFVEMVKTSAESAEQTKLLSEKAGVTTDTFQKLAYAASFVNVSGEEMGNILAIMSRNAYQAAQGSTQLQSAFAKVGITFSDLKHLTPEEQFLRLQEALKRLKETGREGEAGALAQILLGRGGKSIIPLLSKDLRKLAQEAVDLGEVRAPEELEKGEEYAQSMKRLDHALTALKNTVAGPLFDAFSKATLRLVKIVSWFRQLVKDNPLVKQAILGIIAVSTALAVALGAVTVAYGVMQAAAIASSLASAAAGLVAAGPWILLGATIVAVFGGLYLLVEDFMYFLAGKKSLIGEVGEKLAKAFDDFTKPHEGDPWFLRVIREAAGILESITVSLAQLQSNPLFQGFLNGALFVGGAIAPDAAKAVAGAAISNTANHFAESNASKSLVNLSPVLHVHIQSTGDVGQDAKASVKAFDDYVQKLMREAQNGRLR